VDRRRERLAPARDFEEFEAVRRARVLDDFLVRLLPGVERDGERAVVERDLVERALLELGRANDFFDRERCDLVSPFSARILFTVRAATSSARLP
jgi:hypothetical protein